MIQRAIAILLLIGVALLGYGYAEAVRTPVVRTLAVRWPGWTGPPITLLLMADIHVAEPDMPPARLARIVAQANALAPDCVLIAGDMVSDKMVATRHVPTAEAVAPLAGLRPRLTTIAVPGNHDHWRGGADMATALRGVGVTVLANAAARCGPIAVAGVDDDFTGRADVPKTIAAARALGGPRLMLSHSPDVFPAARGVPLVLAGHTHCGQIAPPLIGPLSTMSRYGRRYACGVVSESGRQLVVTSGIGTSLLPLRIGAPPEMWLIRIGAPAP
ncbi:metallophosphoesterase [Sphingomonas sp. 1P06PA]|uniref:metallophosphoesterase n=1 Tax=Sphingomonas sp. 1P06PA TaxID=554121 RepID=UPI0039A71EAD